MKIIAPGDCPAPARELAGGKGVALLELAGEGYPIPPFLVLAFERGEDPGASAEQIEAAVVGLGAAPLAVRSSADVEDAAVHNFAGMFVTRLGVHPGEVVEAVRDVVDSTATERVESYTGRVGVPLHAVRMSVIVQGLVVSEVAGVAMSAGSLTGDEVCVECCLGLGEALVSGREPGDRYLMRRSDLTVSSAAVRPQARQCVLAVDGRSSTYEPVPFYKRNRKKLSDERIREVASLAVALEERAGGPVVIEFAYAEGRLWLLQCRPSPA